MVQANKGKSDTHLLAILCLLGLEGLIVRIVDNSVSVAKLGLLDHRHVP
jgi:hypothetical protein